MAGLPYHSRYAQYANPAKYLVLQTSERYLGLRLPIELAPDPTTDHYLTVEAGERPDQIAARVPGWATALGEDRASQLWWILFDLAGIVNPFDVAAGTVLRCPSADRVIELLQG